MSGSSASANSRAGGGKIKAQREQHHTAGDLQRQKSDRFKEPQERIAHEHEGRAALEGNQHLAQNHPRALPGSHRCARHWRRWGMLPNGSVMSSNRTVADAKL